MDNEAFVGFMNCFANNILFYSILVSERFFENFVEVYYAGEKC